MTPTAQSPDEGEEQPQTHEQAIETGGSAGAVVPIAMPLMEHLGEMRKRIVVSLVVFVVATLVGLWFAPAVLQMLMRPLQSLPAPAMADALLVLKPQESGLFQLALSTGESITTENVSRISTDSLRIDLPGAIAPIVLGRAARAPSDLYFLSPVEPFMLLLQAALLFGCLAGIPVVLYQAWGFVRPGLHVRERDLVKPALVWSALLFPIGATFAWATIGLALNVLLNFGSRIPGLQPNLVASQYVSFVLTMMTVSGIFFEFPLVMVLLGYLGLIKSETLARRRKESIVGLAILAALFTPPDPFTMTAMLVPLAALYELSIVLVRTVERKKKAVA